MELNPVEQKQHAHVMIDLLGPDKLTAVVGLLEVMLDPVSHSMAHAPYEDEEITPELAAELDAAQVSLNRGEGTPHEEVLSHYGLNLR
jgi:hypothetical protein